MRGELMEKQYEVPMGFRSGHSFMTAEEVTMRAVDMFTRALANEQQKHAIIIF